MGYLIAATCKHYGINKIATFDPDFKGVDFLEVITSERIYFFKAAIMGSGEEHLQKLRFAR